MGAFDNLPEPNQNGLCVDCLRKDAVTRDRRFCLTCLKRRVARDNPMVGCFKGRQRTSDHKQDTGDGSPSPWGENAVRAMEEGSSAWAS